MKFNPDVTRYSRSRATQQGFTLIELIVVLVILGILAAFAIPRFANVNKEAREAATRGLAGSLRSASALVHGLAMARGLSGGTVTLEGTAVTLVNGYPAASAAGIGNSVLNLDGFTVTAPTGTPPAITYVTENAPAASATCSVTYTEAPAGGAAVVVLNDSDCS